MIAPNPSPGRAEGAARSPIALLGEGNLAAAEIASRIVLQEGGPAWREALGVRAGIAAAAGFWGYAERFLTAQRAETAAEARTLLNGVRAVPGRRRARGETGRFLVARAWGCGLWSDINHVLGCALLAELTGRRLAVHWGANSLYNEGAADVFSTFFESSGIAAVWDGIHLAYGGPEPFGRAVLRQSVVRTPTLIDMLRSDADVIVSDRYVGVVDAIAWAPGGLWPDARRTASRYRRLAARHLTLRPLIANAVAAFVAARFGGHPFAAVHIRGTDKHNDVPDLDAVNRRTIDTLEHLDPALKIFVLTDDAGMLAELHGRFPGRVVSTEAVRSDDGAPIHVGGRRAGRIDAAASWIPPTCPRATRLGMEVLLDTYVALAADTFVGNGRSNVSAAIALLKDWAPGKCVLLAPNQLLESIDWGISI